MVESKTTKKRKDWLKSKAKVAKALIINPLLTDREVEKETWISKSASNRVRKELGQDGTKDLDIMKRILETDDAIIDLVNQYQLSEIIQTIEDWDKLSWSEQKILWDLANNSTKRKAIFWKNDESDKTFNFIIN